MHRGTRRERSAARALSLRTFVSCFRPSFLPQPRSDSFFRPRRRRRARFPTRRVAVHYGGTNNSRGRRRRGPRHVPRRFPLAAIARWGCRANCRPGNFDASGLTGLTSSAGFSLEAAGQRRNSLELCARTLCCKPGGFDAKQAPRRAPRMKRHVIARSARIESYFRV